MIYTEIGSVDSFVYKWNMDFDMLSDDYEYDRTGCYGDR